MSGDKAITRRPSNDFLATLLRQPRSWFNCADDLSELLEELGNGAKAQFAVMHAHFDRKGNAFVGHPQVWGRYRAFLLLASNAVENYVKGFWVVENFRLITNGFPGPLKTHNLLELSNKLRGVKFSNEEQPVLSRLSMARLWYAGYPGPLEGKNFELFGGGEHEIDRVLALQKRLAALSKGVNLGPDGLPI